MPKVLLVVEDDPLMSRMYQKIFSFEKYEVEMAADGEEALDKVHHFKPTVILLDVMMPKMNGLEVLERLKANPDTKNIPVIMLTNLAGQQDAETALARGAVKYIIKSEHEPKEVASIVNEVVAGYTRNDVPPAAPAGPPPQDPTPTPAAPPVDPPQSPTDTPPPAPAQ